MNLKKIDTPQSTEQTTSSQSAGLTVKSHVKAGVTTARPIAVCG